MYIINLDIKVMFAQPTYTFAENGGVGQVEVITSAAAPESFQVRVTGSKLLVTDMYLCTSIDSFLPVNYT